MYCDAYWKTVSIRNGHPFRPLAALRLPDSLPPFLAAAKLPSIKPSAQSILPLRSSKRIMRRQALLKEPSFAHLWSRRWQLDLAGYFAGNSFHGAPVLRIHKIPLKISRSEALGRPLPSCLRDGTLKNRRMYFHSLLFKSIAESSFLRNYDGIASAPSGLAKTGDMKSGKFYLENRAAAILGIASRKLAPITPSGLPYHGRRNSSGDLGIRVLRLRCAPNGAQGPADGNGLRAPQGACCKIKLCLGPHRVRARNV